MHGAQPLAPENGAESVNRVSAQNAYQDIGGNGLDELPGGELWLNA
jgi:hypothetical protein